MQLLRNHPKEILEPMEMEWQILLTSYFQYLKQYRNLRTKFKNITTNFLQIKIISSKLTRWTNKVKMEDK